MYTALRPRRPLLRSAINRTANSAREARSWGEDADDNETPPPVAVSNPVLQHYLQISADT